MSIVIGFFITVIFIGIAVGLMLYFKSKLKSFESTKFDKSEDDKIENTQDFLPFADIHTNRIDLGGNRYIMILKVQPFNYLIQSSDGKDAFAIKLRRAYNSLDFKTHIFTHTKKMVNDKMLEHLSSTIDEFVGDNPEQQNYADEYFRKLSVVNLQNTETGELRKVKEYYVLVPFEPTEDYAGMDSSELAIVAKDEMRNRLSQTQECLLAAGVTSSFLNSVQIIELLASIYRREESNRADLLFDKQYLSELVEGDRESLSVDNKVKLSSIIQGALSQIDGEIISSGNIDAKTRNVGVKTFEILSQLENKINEK